jgi:hypothetical protein
MRKLSDAEMLSLRELLQMETNALAAAKVTQVAIQNSQLKSLTESGVLAAESRIRGLQQFIQENDIIPIQEVH